MAINDIMKDFFHQSISADMRIEFDEYILNGGFPKSLEFPNVPDRQFYTREIIHEIFEKDVKSRRRISNPALFERIQSFLINNYASPFSLGNLIGTLEKEGIKTKPQTVQKYINYLKQAKIIYECNRFDLKSKRSLRRDQKYYLTDLALYFATNVDNRLSYGPALENIVYFYLLSNNYQVSVGKIGELECDFIIRNSEQQYAYIQVVYSLQAGDEKHTAQLQEREYRPFRKIKDGYPRYIISLDSFRDQREGVHHINAIDLFLGKEKI